jgi:hypothetical protein
MSERTEKKLAEFGQWWHYHAGINEAEGVLDFKLPEDMNKRTELMAKAVHSLAHIYIDIVEDIRVLEGRGPIGSKVSKIITPDNVLKRNHG